MFYETNFVSRTNKSNLDTNLVDDIYINCSKKFHKISNFKHLGSNIPKKFIFIVIFDSIFLSCL